MAFGNSHTLPSALAPSAQAYYIHDGYCGAKLLLFPSPFNFPPCFRKNGTILSLVTFFYACSHVTCNWVRALVLYVVTGHLG